MRKIIAIILFSVLAAMAIAAEVKLDSYTIERQPLRSTITAVDASGKKRAFDEVYIVRIKGKIPTFGANPVRFFIGDEPVREYGSTEDGIYFKVYDADVLRRWNGKPIRYVLEPGKPQESGLTFRSEQLPQ